MKKIFITLLNLLFCLFLFSSCQGGREMQTARTHLNMNSDWAFYRGDVADGARIGLDDSGWIAASLPHIMQLEKKHCGGDIIYDGVGWYRRYFTLSEEYKEKRIVISFEGVMNACDVYMNEERVATHHGGYVGFVCDVSDAINWSGNNLLAVRVSAEHDPLTPPGKPQDRMDFYYYSGIYRDVEMVITDKLYVTDALEEDEVAGGGLFVTYPEVTKETARVHVKTQLRNHYETAKEGHLRTLLVDEKHKIITDQTTPFTLNANGNTTIEQDLTVDNPSLWHPYSPYLYGLRTEVVVDGEVVDDQYTPVGIRTIAYTTEDGFFINGEKLYLRGTNRHQAYQNVGDAASNSMQERDVIDMKRGGFNAVRAAHYPQDPAFLDACDKYGLLVVECIPGWQYFLNDSTFINRLYEVGRQMIRRDRNHPSVVLWETALNESRYPVELAKDLFDIAHAEYPGDQMYTAGDYLGHADMEPYYDVFYKQVSKYPKDGNVMSNYLEDQVAVKPLFTREWGDGAGEKPRVSLLENEEEQMKQCRSRFRQLNGDGYFDWCMLDANPRMGGHFMWSYNDYARGSQEETLFCGVVDINRYPKFSYYMSQSMRAHSISQKGLYEGPMVYIASYNAGEEYVSSTTDITVFSNCEEVKLYRNGKLVGKKTRDGSAPSYQSIVDKGGSPCFIFDAGSYEAGELKAEAFVGGKRVATHRVRTPEEAHHIEVVVHDAGIQPIADGSDMVPVYFKICDKNGTLVNSSRAVIDIQVSGEGALIGGGIERIGVSPQEVEGGIGYGFIRTTKKAGKITITATSEGLEAGTAHVYSQPFSGNYVADGTHGRFHGNEEDGVVVKQSAWERQVSAREPLPVAEVIVSGAQKDYPASHITDGNDKSWWIADSDVYPQVVTIGLKEAMRVLACRIVFQKDSSYYTHKIEVSRDGENWMQLYEREVTGWEFKPLRINRTIKYLRITIENVSEGRAGIGEVTLY